MKIDRIVLTTDFSDCAAHAFAPTASLARRLEVGIDLVHAFEFPVAGFDITAFDPWRYRAQLAARLEETRRQAVFDGLEVQPVLVEGYGADAVHKHQESIPNALLAITSHGRTGLRHLLLGSFTERVLRTASCPVLTFRRRPQSEFQPKRILFPFDFSTPARAALDAVRFFADAFGASIHAFHVREGDVQPVPSVPPNLLLPPELLLYMEREQGRAQDELAKIAAREFPGHTVEAKTVLGRPVNAILREARDARIDLIVMATHGRTGLRHAFLGSVAEGVVRRATCSTITVRSTEGLSRGDTDTESAREF